MEYNSNYMESIFNYIGHKRKKQTCNLDSRFFYIGLCDIASFFSLVCLNNGLFFFCDFESFTSHWLTAVRNIRYVPGMQCKSISETVCMLM